MSEDVTPSLGKVDLRANAAVSRLNSSVNFLRVFANVHLQILL
jgi:hypothetical protein